MILYKRSSSLRQDLKVSLGNKPYIIINVLFAAIIICIIAYCFIFSPDKDNYPIVCIHEKLTGNPCISCGLSHSFSLIIRGRVDEAYQWNPNGMRVLIFFLSQLIFRIVYSIYYLWYPDTRKQLIILDCIGSGLIFLISFWPFIINIFLVI
jgi:hypothetical protein